MIQALPAIQKLPDLWTRPWTVANASVVQKEGGLSVRFAKGGVLTCDLGGQDWSNGAYFAFDVSNPGKQPLTLWVRVDDDLKATDQDHNKMGSMLVAARSNGSFFLAMALDSGPFGMNGLPPARGGQFVWGGWSEHFAMRHVQRVKFWLENPPGTLIFRNARLLPPPRMSGIVDAFGQYSLEDWPGKLHNEGEFARRNSSDERDLAKHPASAVLDEYGGLLSGPICRATGHFRTEKVDGRWWLVTPSGHLFFSKGCNVVDAYATTFVTGREPMFTWLPKRDERLGQFYRDESNGHGAAKSGISYDFYRANLLRRYGDSWQNQFRQLAFRRLPSWGFNTIANWSDSGFYAHSKVPYTATVWIQGEHARLPSGSDYWAQMHDPFDPQFRLSARRAIQEIVSKVGEDPYCLGFFIDNELSWVGYGLEEGRYGLAVGALSLPISSNAKQAMLTGLHERYGTVEKLNAAWQTSFANWSQLAPPHKDAWAYTEAQKADFAAFTRSLSAQYHLVVSEEFRKLDHVHLYLGCRFSETSRDIVRAAAPFTDVLSFNMYVEKPDRQRWIWLAELDKPVLIGEFHFGATDRGMFHCGLVDAKTQKHRAELYRQYVEEVARTPFYVGCHWFEYVDEPLTGRVFDGENYQIGMVDVTDTPYPETIAAARRAHERVYSLHLHAK